MGKNFIILSFESLKITIFENKKGHFFYFIKNTFFFPNFISKTDEKCVTTFDRALSSKSY